MKLTHLGIACWFAIGICATAADSRPDLLLADFEGPDYGEWKVSGEAFGPGPARGTLPNQMKVDGFLGKGLVNSFYKGDGSTGSLVSPEFKIERHYIKFLIGGGGHPGQTCMNLKVDGKIVRTATGPNTRPGGSERLDWQHWDVAEFEGKHATIEILDMATGGWGHINVDHIVQSDTPPPRWLANATRQFVVEKRYLNLPVKNGAAKRNVQILVDGRRERFFDIELADSQPDWWAFLDLQPWRGKTITVQVDRLREDSGALESIAQSDTIKGGDDMYREALRPQFHFSSRRGWNNDPNGLVYYEGEYHLFYQHNPFGWNWGNMHWGHAVSRDLVKWQELNDALAPDELGPMFSGSAVVDWENTSGLGAAGRPPMVLIYTAAGHPTVQCIASSTNGRDFVKFSGNPVLKEITPGNRDPKVMWHAPSRRWVMALYVGKDKKHTIHFLTSPDLKSWEISGEIDGFFECPDLFELPLDGDPGKKKWILTAASSDYMVGVFDGRQFKPETPKLKGHRGRGFYAEQTFSDILPADGRRIQIGWLQAPSPGMPFNQAMSLPLELGLVSTDDGPRMTFAPARELAALRARHYSFPTKTLKAGDANPLADVRAELIELRLEFQPKTGARLELDVRGAKISYSAAKQELAVNDHRTNAPLRQGRQRLVVYCDRTALEIFASDDLVYVPMPFIPRADNRSSSLAVVEGEVAIGSLSVYELRSIW